MILFAASHYLSMFKGKPIIDWEPDELINALEDYTDGDTVVVYEPYELIPLADLIEEVLSLNSHLKNYLSTGELP